MAKAAEPPRMLVSGCGSWGMWMSSRMIMPREMLDIGGVGDDMVAG